MAKVSNKPSVSAAQLKQAELQSPNGPAPDGPGELHTVVAGDTLWGLAENKLGDGSRWGEIADLNPQVKDPDKLWPGDQLRLPEVGAPKLSEAEVDTKTGQADNAEVAKNFAQENKGKTTDVPKKSGVLNFLSNKIPAKEMDSSVAEAIDGLKKSDPPISGELMQQAVVEGTKDLDNSAAGKEFDQLSGFVKNNYDKFSPDAKAKFRVYEKYARRARKEGKTGIPQDQYDKMVSEMGKAGYLDETSGAAVEQLRTEKKPISGEAMHKAIVDGAGDLDNQAAGNEYKDLKKFVKKNWDKMSPEAQQKFEIYEKTARRAIKKGDSGVSTATWDKMVAKMDKIGNASPATVSPSIEPSPTMADDLKNQAAVLQSNDRFISVAKKVLSPESEGGKAITGKEARTLVEQLDKAPASSRAELSDNFKYALQNNGIEIKPKARQILAKHFGVAPESLGGSTATARADAADEAKSFAPIFDRYQVPQDARSPQLGQALTDLEAQATGRPTTTPLAERPGVQSMMQIQNAASAMNPALYPPGDAETAALAQGMGMKPPLSFEDQLFLLQMKYASNKEREIMDKMNELAGGAGIPGQNPGLAAGGPRGQVMQQNGTPTYNPGGAAPNPAQGQQPMPQPKMSPELQRLMQQKAQFEAMQAGQVPMQPGARAPQGTLPPQAQQEVGQIFMNLQAAIQNFESPGSEGGAMIALNEMNKLIGIAKQLPPEMQQELKAAAYQAAMAEGGLTPEAFQSLMAYVNEPASGAGAQAQQGAQAAQGAQSAQGPGMPGMPNLETGKKKEEQPYNPTEDARNLRDAMRGFGTDEDKLFKALEGKTPEQMQQLAAAYKKMYGDDLATDLRGDLSGADEKRALALLDGKVAQADAQVLAKAMRGNYDIIAGINATDEQAIFDTLEGKSPEQLKAISAEYKKTTGKDLQADLNDELSGAELKRAQASLQGNPAGATAMALSKAMKGNYGFKMGTDEDAIFKALENVDPRQLPHVAEEYKTLTGRDLASDVKSELSGLDEMRALALLSGERGRADAAVLRKAMHGNSNLSPLGTDEEAIFKLLEGASNKQRAAMAAAYQQIFGESLEADLRSELSLGEEDRALAALNRVD